MTGQEMAQDWLPDLHPRLQAGLSRNLGGSVFSMDVPRDPLLRVKIHLRGYGRGMTQELAHFRDANI